MSCQAVAFTRAMPISVQRYSVRPSVCFMISRLQTAACRYGGFAAVRPVTAIAAAAANASNVTLSVDA